MRPIIPVLASCSLVTLSALVACQPRRGKGEALSPTASATPPTATATATTTAPTTAPTTTATAAPTGGIFGIPGLGFPGLPASPRQAMIGNWKVAAIDGKAVATAPGMATDPLDPASYVAGASVTFTAETVTLARAGVTVYSRPYKVLSENPPMRVTIDAGNGPSNVDFALDGSCVWSLPSAPPHALSLTRGM